MVPEVIIYILYQTRMSISNVYIFATIKTHRKTAGIFSKICSLIKLNRVVGCIHLGILHVTYLVLIVGNNINFDFASLVRIVLVVK